MVQVAIFKEIFRSSAKKDLDCELFYSELKRQATSHIIFTIQSQIIFTSC